MNFTSRSKPAQTRNSGGTSTRAALSISTSVALPMKMRRQGSCSEDSASSSVSNFSHTGKGNSDKQPSGHSGGRQIVGVLPDNFYALNITMVLGLPITGFYVIILALLMWFVYEYTPSGRYLYAIGASPKAAALNGIPVRKYVMGSFIASGLLTALAGVLLAAKLRIGWAQRAANICVKRRSKRTWPSWSPSSSISR